jgi:DUF1365 family protein
VHEFTNAVRYVWIDPNRPDDLTRHHWAWSSTWPAPMRFRARDYGRSEPAGVATSLADQARDDLAVALGRRPSGEVRMLSQIRHLGWLFNPITVFVVWDADPDVPVGAVLEVTNTPWKERHRYPVALALHDGRFVARFPKELHVSPFLDEDFDYLLAIDDRDDRIVMSLDVVPGDDGAASADPDRIASTARAVGDPATPDGDPTPTVSVRLDVDRLPAGPRALAAALRAVPLSTQRVSAGIHAQAFALWRKRVPFVAHPRKRTTTEEHHPGEPTATEQAHQVDPPVDDRLGGNTRR